QVKEAFVYFPDKTGTLNDYGRELLGIGKMGTQGTLMRRYIAGDLAYVEQFQLRQIEITNGLYQLFRFSSSESIMSSLVIPEVSSTPEMPVAPVQTGMKHCPNCKAEQLIDTKICSICGQSI
ncbi:unnamed protein product, partial [marine sediment metagenome]